MQDKTNLKNIPGETVLRRGAWSFSWRLAQPDRNGGDVSPSTWTRSAPRPQSSAAPELMAEDSAQGAQGCPLEKRDWFASTPREPIIQDLHHACGWLSFLEAMLRQISTPGQRHSQLEILPVEVRQTSECQRNDREATLNSRIMRSKRARERIWPSMGEVPDSTPTVPM